MKLILSCSPPNITICGCLVGLENLLGLMDSNRKSINGERTVRLPFQASSERGLYFRGQYSKRTVAILKIESWHTPPRTPACSTHCWVTQHKYIHTLCEISHNNQKSFGKISRSCNVVVQKHTQNRNKFIAGRYEMCYVYSFRDSVGLNIFAFIQYMFKTHQVTERRMDL